MTPGTAQYQRGPGTPAGTVAGATCDDHHVFPRDRFTRVARAEVWCDKPVGHDGPHEAIKGSTAFVWEATDVA